MKARRATVQGSAHVIAMTRAHGEQMGASPRQWVFRGPDGALFRIRAENWIIALGIGMERLDALDVVGRLVCRHQEGLIIADDVSTQRRYILRALDEDSHPAAA